MFEFTLTKKEVPEADLMKQEMQRLTIHRQKLMKDLKLFQYFFFNVYNEPEYKKNILPKLNPT